MDRYTWMPSLRVQGLCKVWRLLLNDVLVKLRCRDNICHFWSCTRHGGWSGWFCSDLGAALSVSQILGQFIGFILELRSIWLLCSLSLNYSLMMLIEFLTQNFFYFWLSLIYHRDLLLNLIRFFFEYRRNSFGLTTASRPQTFTLTIRLLSLDLQLHHHTISGRRRDDHIIWRLWINSNLKFVVVGVVVSFLKLTEVNIIGL